MDLYGKVNQTTYLHSNCLGDPLAVLHGAQDRILTFAASFRQTGVNCSSIFSVTYPERRRQLRRFQNRCGTNTQLLPPRLGKPRGINRRYRDIKTLSLDRI